ncbi:MAG: hypothetical protein ABI900_07085 [Betaproteobacteria bacterium]
MIRGLGRSLLLIAASVFALAAGADVAGAPPAASATEPSQGFIVAMPPTSNATAANKVAEEPQRLPPTEVRGYRDVRVPCDPRQGMGQEACREQLAAKYAEMDRLCRVVSGTELPVCIKSAYAPD